jgi:hypothetical protein
MVFLMMSELFLVIFVFSFGIFGKSENADGSCYSSPPDVFI